MMPALEAARKRTLNEYVSIKMNIDVLKRQMKEQVQKSIIRLKERKKEILETVNDPVALRRWALDEQSSLN